MQRFAHLLVALLVGAAIAGTAVHFRTLARVEREARAETERLLTELSARLDSASRAAARTADSTARAHAAKLDSIQRDQRRLADSIRSVRVAIPLPDSTVRDSLRFWHQTATAATAESERLRAALDAADSTALVQVGRIARLTAEAQADAAHMAAQDRTIASLNARLAIQPAVKDCRVLGVLSCPSRTTSFVAGVAATAVVTLYAVAQ